MSEFHIRQLYWQKCCKSSLARLTNLSLSISACMCEFVRWLVCELAIGIDTLLRLL